MNNTHELPALLWAVMSVREVDAVYHLAKGTARQAARRGLLPCRRADHLYLVCRADADARWGERIHTDAPPHPPARADANEATEITD